MAESRIPRIIFLDIETSDLKADWGSLLCVGVLRSWDNKLLCPSILDHPGKYPSDDKQLVKAILPMLEDCNLIVTWYGGGFDLKFIKTKCVEHRLPFPNIPAHVDLWVTPFKEWVLTSNRLANVQEFLNLPDEKTGLKKAMWRRARAGDKSALKYVIDHCKKDVVVLKEAYYEIRPYIVNHPTLTLQKCHESATVRDTVEAIAEGEIISQSKLGKRLGLTKSTISWRVSQAINMGWLMNVETRSGVPAKLKRTGPLPISQDTTVPHQGSCPICVTGTLRKDGFYRTRSGSYQRYTCGQCKHKSRDTRRTEGVSIVPV